MVVVKAEILAIGSELLEPPREETNGPFLTEQLRALGIDVVARQVVADERALLESAFRAALARVDVVIATGGLGPTSDDLTRDLIAQLLGKELRRDEAVLDHIKKRFAARNLPMPKNNEVQALVPEGALVLANPNGTAPGLAMEVNLNEDGGSRIGDGKKSRPPSSILHPVARQSAAKTAQSSPLKKWLVMLPGPPRELRPMFDEQVVPLLRREYPPAAPFVCRTLRTGGIAESRVQEKLGSPLYKLEAMGLEVGYCARVGQVDVRLSARGTDAERVVREAAAIVQRTFGAQIYGYDDEEIEAVVVRLLAERRKTLVLAESCTGGCIAHRVTNVPGASAVFPGGFVTYSNEAKQKCLGVRAETLAAQGAVSEAVAQEMAEGARRATGADYALAVTGIAGPGGGTSDKPVGTVFIALAGATGTTVERRTNSYERETFKLLTAQQALEKLRVQLISL
jgi:nicotinamide-nucleotide amidase